MKTITLNNTIFNNQLPFVLIAGPCQIESIQHGFEIASQIAEIAKKFNISYVYKSSFDKANRTSIASPRGAGLEQGIELFTKIRNELHCHILTDIHESYQAEIIAPYVDIIQVPALLCRQTDLITAICATNKIINIKKGQFLAPEDMLNIINKCTTNDKILITERGTCFGYNNLINDMKGLYTMRDMGYPIIFDATHSVQRPGSLQNKSGGDRKFIEPLLRAAVAIGVAGIFIETHDDPNNALSDGPCMLPLCHLENLLSILQSLDEISKKIHYTNMMY